MVSKPPNKRRAVKGEFGVLWCPGRAWPALPDRDRWAAASQPVPFRVSMNENPGDLAKLNQYRANDVRAAKTNAPGTLSVPS